MYQTDTWLSKQRNPFFRLKVFDPSKHGLDARFVFQALTPVVIGAVVPWDSPRRRCAFSGYLGFLAMSHQISSSRTS